MTIQVAKHRKFKDLEFWAEEGMVCIEDQRDGDFHVKIVRDMLETASAINKMTYDLMRDGKYIDERAEHVRFVEDAIQTCREARNQGDPTNPAVVRERIRNRRRSRILTPSRENMAIAFETPLGAIPTASSTSPMYDLTLNLIVPKHNTTDTSTGEAKDGDDTAGSV